MKVGRNEPCPCGSGKKYKFCHLNNSTADTLAKGQDLNLKGKVAEEIVQYLAEKTFLTDWCYRNPMLQKGKELCDLLIVFGDIAIIWQIKNLKLGKDGKYNKSEVDKNLRQLSGARRSLLSENKIIELDNPRRGKEFFNPKTIKEIYLISALVGKKEDYAYFMEDFKNLTIHVFDREFTQIVLNELDTIKDFIDYLRATESFRKTGKGLMIMGGEKELLAYYLMNNRGFVSFNKATMVMLDEGAWKTLQRKPEYIAKKQADRISYGWDSMINSAHETGSSQYEEVAREMARLSRFERRNLSNQFLDAHAKAHEEKIHNIYRRLLLGKETTYCFLFMDDPEPRERRRTLLTTMCYIARGKKIKNKKVLGIATEMKMKPQASYDYCLFIKPSWSKKDQLEMERLQGLTGIFVNPKMSITHEDEYPKIIT